MSGKNHSIFIAVILIFSAAALLLTLLSFAKLAVLEDMTETLNTEISELKKENALLRACTDNSMSLEELEEYAVDVLGMQHPQPEQTEKEEIEDIK